jgi:hypothetical protein
MFIAPIPAPVPLVGNTETVVAISDVLDSSGGGGGNVCVHGVLNVTAGTGTTQVRVAVRRGSDVTGPLIGMPDGNGHYYRQHSLSAASVKQLAFCECDMAVPDYAQWVVTVQQVGATGNGVVGAGCACVDVTD